MKVEQIKVNVMNLSLPELMTFKQWRDQFVALQWDKQIENDLEAGRLDALLAEVDEEYEAGLAHPLWNISPYHVSGGIIGNCQKKYET